MPLFFCRLFFSSAKKWKNCAIVPSGHWALNTMTTNCDPMKCSHIWSRVLSWWWLTLSWRTTGFLRIKLFCQLFCISTCLDYDHPEHHGANAQNTYRRIHRSYCSRPIHAKRCYWAVIWNGLSRQRLKALNALYAKYANVLVEKRTLVVKSKIWNLKPNCIYSMQSVE